MLPEPSSTRFQPLRSGLINLFKYENQQFWYERGRLLVRGNNGSGKSRVLALQLPFLLDGEISPSRVEPDGDVARSMAWHLLMDDYEQRSGYTWIEFGRRDQQGACHYLTLGCGMRAIRGGDNQPVRWFFVTEKRIDQDLNLLNGRQPLSSEQLGTVIGKEAIFKTAGEYRKEVDRRLFQLGEERYAALLELLIRLRAPQLAKKLDEKTLYAALSDALPPLPARLIDEVAVAFKNLDTLRDELAGLERLAQAVASFQQGYERYLQSAIARRAEAVRSRHAAYERAQRDIAELQRQLEQTRKAESEAGAALKIADGRIAVAEAHLEALRKSPESLDAEALDSADREAKAARGRAAGTTALAATQANRLAQAEQLRYEHAAQHESRTKDFVAALPHALEQAAAAACSAEHARRVPEFSSWKVVPDPLPALRRDLATAVRSQRTRLAQAETLRAEMTRAEKELAAAQVHETRLGDDVTRLRGEEQVLDARARDAVRGLGESYPLWRNGLRWLMPQPWEELSDSFAEWLESGSESTRVLPSVLESAMGAERAAHATASAELEMRRKIIGTQRTELRAERDRLEQGRTEPPLAPATRDGQSRADRPGAPLWQVCEFRPGLDQEQQAGLEAALEAAGLLDAWLMPDGTLAARDFADTFLASQVPTSALENGATLADWLQPDLAESETSVHGLSAACIRLALTRIGAGESGEHWVALDGHWKLGPAYGRGVKARSAYLGATSREAARQRRLQEIAEQWTVLDTQVAALERDAADLVTRAVAAAEERRRAPTDEAIATAITLRSGVQRQLTQAREKLAAAEEVTRATRLRANAARTTYERDATLLGFRDFLDRLDEVKVALSVYETALEKLYGAAQAWITSVRRGEELAAGYSRAAEDVASSAAAAEGAEREAAEKEEHFRTLTQTLGAGIAEYQTKLSAAREDRSKAKAEHAAADRAQRESAEARIRHETALGPKEAELTQAVGERDEAIRALRLPMLHGLFPETKPSLGVIECDDWSITRAVEIARLIDRELPDTDSEDADWNRRQTVLQTQIADLQRALGAQGYTPQARVISEGLSIVECPFQGRTLAPAALRTAVELERETREKLLSASEREIIDNHLIAEVSLHLQNLILDVNDRKEAMNAEMTRCTTSLGLTLRLIWEPLDEGMPTDLPVVRKLILADHALWRPEEKTAVGAFLHRLIQDERTRDPVATWTEHLARALDYRRWHTFGIERHQNGRWERLTRKRYGTGSGGEKALMLTVPQMAAAAAHYRSALPQAPHLILLDEAFAGMDSTLRARCMGLLESFDLDFVMTSEREWGAHATISGLAIYQLVTDADAVATTRWVWNGKQKVLAPVADTPSASLRAGSLTPLAPPDVSSQP